MLQKLTRDIIVIMSAGAKPTDSPSRSLLQAHPWHGISPGKNAPQSVNVFIEIVPTDVVKYELDKESGHLKIDRPQRFSSLCPAPYGFIPQTFCGREVGLLCGVRAGLEEINGDGDPMDICVLTEKSLAHGNCLMTARPIGGLLMIDGHEADDKIIAVLESDLAYGHFQDISDCPKSLVDRLRHYFLSYKQLPQEAPRRVEIIEVYNRDAAMEVIAASFKDYRERFGVSQP